MRPKPLFRISRKIFPLAIPLALSLPAGCAWVSAPDGTASPGHVVLIAAAQGEIRTDADPMAGSPFGAYLAGLFATNQRDLSSAADFMLQVLAYDPDDRQLLNRTLVLVASDGRHDTAVEIARRLDKVDPGNALAVLVLAVDAVARNDLDAADAVLERLPQRGVSAITRPLLRAWAAAMRGDTEAALERVAPLKNRAGFGVLYSLHAALIDDLAGRSEAARQAYDAALEAATQPSLRLTWLVGNFFERSGARERAIEVYRDFLARDPDSVLIARALRRAEAGETPAPVITDARAGMAESLFNLASLLSRERAEEIAMIHVHMALRLRPDFMVARILLAEILQGQGRGEKAIAVYRELPSDSPFAWTVGLRVADELERLDRVEEAIAEYERLAAARPDRYEPLLRLGNLLRNRERFAEAVDAYDRAAARIGTPQRRHWTLFYFRGIALERLSQWERAERDFLLALELEPEQPFVMNYLAYSWVEKKLHLDKAKSMLVRAVELRPDDGYIVDSLGWVYYRLGEYDKGVQYLERAVELRPQDPVINDHLGDAYWRVGRRHEARFQWRRALSLDPEEDVAEKIRAKLQRGLVDAPKDI